MIREQPTFLQGVGRLIKITTALGGLLLIAVFACILYVYFFFAKDLPDLSSIKNYDPPVLSEVFAKDGTKVGEFWTQKRVLLPYKQIPKRVIQAFLASEDTRFFEHPGVDFRGIVRAFLKNLRAGKVVQGGSTITQQVARSLLLSRSRTYERKVKEALLATKIEQSLTKEEILYLYLNQIYLGNRSYGIQAAALNYFHKPTDQLNLGEIAMIAGLPTAPAAFSPINNPKGAKERQKFVLNRMIDAGWATLAEAKEAYQATLKIYHAPTDKEYNARTVPYFTEEVRRHIQELYGDEVLYKGGLKIYTPLDLKAQLAAQKYLQEGLRVIDKRQGFRGPLEVLNAEAWEGFAEQVHREIVATSDDAFFIPPPPESNERPTPLAPDRLYRAVVTNVQDNVLAVSVGHTKGVINHADWQWIYRRPQVGWVVWAQLKANDTPEQTTPTFRLEQEPKLEGALYSLVPQTGEIKAMVGGYDFLRSEFNRSTQTIRQPGSSFKPIIYAAALDKGYTPQTSITDSPVTYQVGIKSFWSPQNYGKNFRGPMTVLSALTHSVNVIAVKIFHDIGIDYVIAFAHKLGIESEIRPYLSSSLGASDVRLSEMVRAYSVFPALGVKPTPTMILKIIDKHGKVLQKQETTETPDHQYSASLQEEDQLNSKLIAKEGPFIQEKKLELSPEEMKILYGARIPPDHVITPQTAYVMTRLMKNVIDRGTGYRAKAIERDAGGKTGTTNDEADAWFIGYTADICTGVWVGFDQRKRIGRGMTGGVIAAPIWTDYMKVAVQETEALPLPTPENLKGKDFIAMTGGSAIFSTIKKELVDEGVALPEGISPSRASDFLFEDIF